jgi:hypothetical protein
MHDREEPHEIGRRTSWSVSVPTAVLVLMLVAFAGVIVGRTSSVPFARAADQPEATATRQAEIDELNRLRTQVAQTAVCVQPTATETPVPTETPPPTATPTPVPPVAMGQPLSYQGDWTVVVTGFLAAPSSDTAPSGKFVQVNATVTNNAASTRKFPFGDWVLVDAAGRVFKMADTATTQLYGPSWYLGIDPSLATDFRIVFDVAADAGPAFILESAADPTFRVAVQLQALG